VGSVPSLFGKISLSVEYLSRTDVVTALQSAISQRKKQQNLQAVLMGALAPSPDLNKRQEGHRDQRIYSENC